MHKYQVHLFDIDGVIIRKTKRFYQYLEEQGYTNAKVLLDSYYANNGDYEALIGKKDPLLLLALVIDALKWPGNTNSFLNEVYRFEEKYVDFDLLNRIKIAKCKDRIFYLATDQDQHRKAYLLERLGLRDYFDNWLISSDIGFRKNEKGFWEKTVKQFSDNGILPKSVLFIDDYDKNLDIAKEYGIATFQIAQDDDVVKIKEYLNGL